MKNCQCHTEIPRDGSGQLSRFLTALDPEYAKVDDRSFSDLLVFAKNYAGHIRFYNLPDDPCVQESWSCFFRNDLTVLAASVAQCDLQQIQKDYIETRNRFEEKPNIDIFKALFEPILGICTQLDKWAYRSSAGFPLRTDVELAISSTLRKQILNIFVLDKSAMLVNKGSDLGLEFDPHNDEVWNLTNANILLDASLYAGANLTDQLFHASLEVDTIFNACFAVISQIVANGDQYLAFSLEKFPKHQPHMALFIAFLQLFKLAQDQLNGLTEKHLNYYYHDILHLTEKPAQPDHVNLIFELAKGTEAFVLKKGTPLSAGKDSLGIEQVYETDREIVLNKAFVKEVSNVFIEKSGDNAEKLKFFSRPIANSSDGFGAPFKHNDDKWNPFGVDAIKAQSDCGDIQNLHALNFAQIGFAIASPQLILEGGNRKIELKIRLINKLLVTSEGKSKSQGIRLSFSVEKGWLDIPFLSEEKNKENFKDNKFIRDFETGFYLDDNDTIHIFLPEKEQALVNYNPKIHAEHPFNTLNPVLRITIADDTAIETNVLEQITLDGKDGEDPNSTNFILKVIVGSIHNKDEEGDINPQRNFDGIKKLVLQNNDSVINSNTFFPFGVYPGNNSSFYVGSEEAFNKELSELSVNIDWLSSELGLIDQALKVSVLSEKVFQDLTIPGQMLDTNILSKYGHFPDGRVNGIEKVTQYIRSETTRGFIQIGLRLERQQEAIRVPTHLLSKVVSANWLSAEQRFAIGLETQAKSVSLSYRSTITSLDDQIDQFFHIYPFGNAEIEVFSEKKGMNGQITKAAANPIINLKAFSLLPNFRYGQNLAENNKAFMNQYTGNTWQEGSLYIGIESLLPPQNLSLLFQIAEGTGIDEDKDLPKINWSYLSNNEWMRLEDSNIVMDTTYGLQTTGIILIEIPELASSDNTIFTKDLHWLAASVDADSHLMPYLIKIVAQAIPATFKDQSNSAAHFQTPLPAGSISRLIPKPAQIKKVDQPFETFDGAPPETAAKFWTRAGERLRHKDRAVSVKDYEKMVLEYFPSVFKVKAVGHTDPNCLCREPEKPVDPKPCCGPQVAPGHVMIIPIENLRNRNSVNILQPKTSRRVLLEIEKFLKMRTSPFVKVHARNPVYEEVLTAFRVQFKSGSDKGYYLDLLNEEIKKYLTPWVYDAFTDVSFAGQIYASQVINFIEERPYVDFIADFMMFLVKCDCCNSRSPEEVRIKEKVLESANDFWNFIRDQSEKISIAEIDAKLNAKTGTDFTYDKYERTLLLKIRQWYNSRFISSSEKVDFQLSTLIEPSSPRSLLVSAEQHVILLYEEDKPPKPCEKG